MTLTWPKVTDIKNPKYRNCRHLCSHCTLRVSNSSDHWCAFGTMSNFEKRNLRSGHLMWPGGVTFGVIGSSFFGNVSNCWLNSYSKFGGATRRRFFAICEKPEGELISAPPAVRGLKLHHSWAEYIDEQWASKSFSLTSTVHMWNFLMIVFPWAYKLLFCREMSASSDISSLKICPRYFTLSTFAIGTLPNIKSGTLTSCILFDLQHIVALLSSLYLTSLDKPNSWQIFNNLCRPLLDGAISTKSSAYIRWLTNFPPTKHPMLSWFSLTLSSSI